MKKSPLDLIGPPPNTKLPLTSMVDMFTIMLVFLLKSFSTDEFNPDLMSGVKPPVSSNGLGLLTGEVLFVSKDAIVFDKKTLLQLRSFSRSPSSSPSKDPLYIQEIAQLYDGKTIEEISKQRIHVVADKETPYPLLKSIFYTLSMSGKTEVELVTVSGDM